MQCTQQLRPTLAQARTEHVREQLMITIPVPYRIQRHEKEIRPFQLAQDIQRLMGFPPTIFTTARQSHHRVAQWTTEPIQDGRTQQEVLHGPRLAAEDLLD